MSEIITNRFVTHEGLKDYDMLLKSWLPNISLAGIRDDGTTTYKQMDAAATALYTYNWNGSDSESNYAHLFQVLADRHRGVFIDTFKNGTADKKDYDNVPSKTDVDNDGNDDIEKKYVDAQGEFNKLQRQHAAFMTFKPHEDTDSVWNKAFTTLFVPRGSDSFRWYTRWWDDGEYHSKTETLLDTANINTKSLVGTENEKYPVSKINTTTLVTDNQDDVNYLLWGSHVDDQGAPYRLQDVTFNPKEDTLSAPTVSATKFNIKTANQYLDNGLYGFDAHNSDIINVNSIYMNDLANDPKEGILWLRDSGGISDVPAQVESGDQAQNSYSADILTAYKGGLYFLPGFSYKLPKKKDGSDAEKWPTAKYQIVTSESSQDENAAPETHEVFSAYTTSGQNKPRPIWVSGIGDGEVRKDGVICPADELTYNSYTRTLSAQIFKGTVTNNGIQITNDYSLSTELTKATASTGFPFWTSDPGGKIYSDTADDSLGKRVRGYAVKGSGTNSDCAYWTIDNNLNMNIGYRNNQGGGYTATTVITKDNIDPGLGKSGGQIQIFAGGKASGLFSVPINIFNKRGTSLGGYKLIWDADEETLIFEEY